MDGTDRRAATARVASPVADGASTFVEDVIAGLSRPQKSLPSRYFYDARGSELFEDITQLPEYYPTRTEIAILSTHAPAIAEAAAPSDPSRTLLIELGSGSSRKTEILLAALPGLRAYVPIDVSPSALAEAQQRLARRFPGQIVRPIVGDFSADIALPADLADTSRAGFFPGSTIGNLTPAEAIRLLTRLREGVLSGGRLIIGVDLKKDARQLVLAYNDAAGVTAAFNLNLLEHINREIEPAFDLARFRHQASYDPVEGRIEMHLVATESHSVRIAGRRFHFRENETIHTENSYKYSIPQFQDLCRAAGWWPVQVWTDPHNMFSVHALAAVEPEV